MPHDGISPVPRVKNHMPKNIFHNLMQPIIFLKIFLVPYAFTGCNLQIGQFDGSASNMIIVFCVNISSSSD